MILESIADARKSMSQRSQWLGPTLVAAVMLAMLVWTWGGWADPLVDFGTQLFVPWRIVRGAVLYRDVAYYNGPLSSYLDAGVFKLIGVGMHRLEAMNFIVLVGLMAVIYRLTLRTAGRWAAVVGGVTIATVFAFGQGVGLGNYNWMTPYTTEVTHGVALGVLAIALLDRHLRTGQIRWAVLTGLVCGAVLLTKAEPTAACGAAVIVRLIAWIWTDRPARRRTLPTVCVLIIGALVVPLLATALLATAMPLREALRGAAGSWPWAFDRRVTSLPFYRGISGVNDIGGNLRSISGWAAMYVAVGAMAMAGAWLARRWGSVARFVILGGFAIATAISFVAVNWPDALRPLPIVLMVAAALTATAVARRRIGPHGLRLALLVYSLALLGKLWLKCHAYHYGFALALPGTLVLVAMLVDRLPVWAAARGGDAWVVRIVGLCLCAAFIIATLIVQKQFLDLKRWTIAADTGDSFRASTRGLEIAAAVNWIDVHTSASDTIAVMPQGLMVNYLARRAAPTRNVNQMPPEVLAVGEPAVVATLDAHPPAAVILDRSAMHNGQFTLDHEYDWGHDICHWVGAHNHPATKIELPMPMPTLYGLQVWVNNRSVQIQGERRGSDHAEAVGEMPLK